jgi:sulfoxide reductase heme-binding subunit YedZ
MNAYIISVVVAVVIILISALISNSIKYEGGSHPKDPRKRKLVFWVMTILAPTLTIVLGALVFHPDQSVNPIAYDEHMQSLPKAAGVSAVTYIVIGFVLSKIFKHGKLGHWF